MQYLPPYAPGSTVMRKASHHPEDAGRIGILNAFFLNVYP
jgi:hypothetical protein